MPVSEKRFDFPDSLKCYYSRRTYGYSSFSVSIKDIFKSDTVTVGEKCDSLFARLEAKYAFFYAKNPPVRDHDSYSKNIIETLYVPEGSLEAYTKAYGGYDDIGNIIEMKKVSNIALRWTSPHQMQPNEHTNLLFEVQPSDAFDKHLKWSSNNEEVATVDEKGEVYAHKSGTATITVTTYDGSVSNSCEIIVAKPVAGVSIEPAEVELTELGKTVQLTAKIQPEDATNKNVTWKSSNEKYPDIIKPILETENQYSKGDGSLDKIMNSHMTGKYVAMCEGDDFWTDPTKLQCQVDFLESHPDYTMCFHDAYVKAEPGRDWYDCFGELQDREYRAPELIKYWKVPTCSIVVRREVFLSRPNNPKYRMGDNVLVMTCLTHGKVWKSTERKALIRLQILLTTILRNTMTDCAL